MERLIESLISFSLFWGIYVFAIVYKRKRDKREYEESMISVQCPSCSQTMKIHKNYGGEFRCSGCNCRLNLSNGKLVKIAEKKETTSFINNYPKPKRYIFESEYHFFCEEIEKAWLGNDGRMRDILRSEIEELYYDDELKEDLVKKLNTSPYRW